ncbi:MAG TPA: peptide-methionine (S)-S-oxide reductase MsrA [Alphaproteobacteria bacterium]
MRFLIVFLLVLLPSVVWAVDVAPKEAKAVFAGGCFWSMQKAFDGKKGVLDTKVGFSGGTISNPSYMRVGEGDTGHYEAVEVTYDPTKISYDKLLNIYWHNIDPVDAEGQFCDKGFRYRTVIFYGTAEEKQKAEDSKMLMEADDERFGGRAIATQILPKMPFYAAEEYHQRYYKKNPLRYDFYRGRCGQDLRLNEIWGKR